MLRSIVSLRRAGYTYSEITSIVCLEQNVVVTRGFCCWVYRMRNAGYRYSELRSILS